MDLLCVKSLYDTAIWYSMESLPRCLSLYYLERGSFMFEALHYFTLCVGAEGDGVEHRPDN